MADVVRRFLVRSPAVVGERAGTVVVSGRLWGEDGYGVLIERRTEVAADGTPGAGSAWVRVAGGKSPYQVQVDLETGAELLRRAAGKVSRTRYRVGRWDVDVYHGANDGVVVASTLQDGSLPDWVGEEVTGRPRYEELAR